MSSVSKNFLPWPFPQTFGLLSRHNFVSSFHKESISGKVVGWIKCDLRIKETQEAEESAWHKCTNAESVFLMKFLMTSMGAKGSVILL